MIKALKKKYALSNQGAKDLLKGIVYSVLANISLMFPVILLLSSSISFLRLFWERVRQRSVPPFTL